MRFSEHSLFARDFKYLSKRFKSLDDDLENIKKLLAWSPRGTDWRHWNVLHHQEQVIVYKARVLCRYLRRSDLRLIYAHFPAENHIEFIEIYFKGDKESEDKKRIKEYLSQYQR